ncbi:hypothetical protein GJ744_005452 [Endocarpon pusillum]|uniref:Uncharacterized protein n=1 Tax=Endocarpon pusillum TaxID=364733 RepID=A0A8H7A3Q5_9EURO|nr:hypothetical protein GJ744_005452 [Endocarpon pusillum]
MGKTKHLEQKLLDGGLPKSRTTNKEKAKGIHPAPKLHNLAIIRTSTEPQGKDSSQSKEG